jgi:uncharacterized protein involved in exopolysaccharide biosynthesis
MTANYSLSGVREAVIRHRGKVFFFLLAVIAASGLTAALTPRSYRSEGKLLVRLGRENATLGPTATLGSESVVAVPSSREPDINSAVELLCSRAVLEKVVDAVGPEKILSPDAPAVSGQSAERRPNRQGEPEAAALAAVAGGDVRGGLSGWWDRYRSDRTLPSRERAVRTLIQRVSAVPVHRSNVIVVSCEGPSPEWAQAVVANLMDCFLSEHVRMNRPRSSREFFASQFARVQRELAEAEGRLRDLRATTGLISPADQRKAMVDRVSRLEDDLLHAEGAAAVAETRLQHLQAKLVELPARQLASATEGFGNEGSDRMADQLYALEVRREEAAAKYAPEHPVMVQLEQQVAAARELLKHRPKTRTQTTTTKSRVLEEAEVALFQEQYAMASSRAQAESLRSQLARARHSLELFNGQEMQIAALERDAEIKRGACRTYAASLEEATTDQAIQSQRISNLTVAEPATFEPVAVRPRKGVILGSGLLLGLCGALALALACDLSDHRLRKPEDVERELNLPVLGCIPRLQEHEVALFRNGDGNGRRHTDDG